ncbi:MAG: EpsG family protein [Fibrobacteraceae bacterium]|nr:EpsG family protein [Fibrobacteraceae bacterium]
MVKKIVLLSAILSLTCFAVMREVSYGVGGTDAITYVKDFLNMRKSLANYIDFEKVLSLQQREPLYYLFGWSVRRVTDNYKVYFFLWHFFIVTGFVYAAAKSYKKDSWGVGSVLPLMLLFAGYIHSFNVMRNWLAIAIAMIGLSFLRRENLKYYFLFLFMAVCIHYSTIVLTLPFLMSKLFKRLDNIKIPLAIFIVVGNMLIYSYISFFSSIFAETKFSSYMEVQSSWFGYLPILLIAVVGLIFYDDLIKMEPSNKFVLWGVALNATMFIAYVKIGAYRINDCFVIFRVWLLIELGRLFYNRFKGWKRVSLVYGTNIFIVAYFLQQLNLLVRTSGIIPYRIG